MTSIRGHMDKATRLAAEATGILAVHTEQGRLQAGQLEVARAKLKAANAELDVAHALATRALEQRKRERIE